MKIKSRFINAIVVASLIIVAQHCAASTKLNKLSLIEVSKSNISTQIMFEFEEPIYFQRAIDTQKHQLMLTFPGMTLNQFKADRVISKLTKLKDLGIINEVTITENTKPFSRVELTLTFKKDPVMAENDVQTPSQNGFLIRWSKMEDPNRLIFDIFSVESLEQMKKKNSFVLTAHNQVKKKALFNHLITITKNA